MFSLTGVGFKNKSATVDFCRDLWYTIFSKFERAV